MEELLSQLKQLGFYQYEKSKTIEILERVSIQTSSPWVFDGNYQYDALDTVTESDGVYANEGLLWFDYPHPQHRLCFLSREDLSECVYAYALEELKPILERSGVTISEIDEFEANNGGSFLRLNEVDYLICPSAVNSVATRTTDKWNFVTAKTLLAANNLLAAAQSEERIYVVRERDEDGLYIAILTFPMFNLIDRVPLLINDLKPQEVETYFAEYLDISRYEVESVSTIAVVREFCEALFPELLEQHPDLPKLLEQQTDLLNQLEDLNPQLSAWYKLFQQMKDAEDRT